MGPVFQQEYSNIREPEARNGIGVGFDVVAANENAMSAPKIFTPSLKPVTP